MDKELKNLKISEELHKYLKIKAAENEMSLYELTELFFKNELEKDKKKQTKRKDE